MPLPKRNASGKVPVVIQKATEEVACLSLGKGMKELPSIEDDLLSMTRAVELQNTSP